MFDPEKVKRGNIDLTGDEFVLASDYDRLLALYDRFLALYRAARRTAEYWKAEHLATNVELVKAVADGCMGPNMDELLAGEPEDWAHELREAGWKSQGMTIWISPGGIIYRGPAHALKMKRAHPELAYLTMQDIAETMPERVR